MRRPSPKRARAAVQRAGASTKAGGGRTSDESACGSPRNWQPPSSTSDSRSNARYTGRPVCVPALQPVQQRRDKVAVGLVGDRVFGSRPDLGMLAHVQDHHRP